MRERINFHLWDDWEDDREPLPCTRPECSVGVHYHWGWGQRQTSLTPVTGYYSFSDGQPFLKEEP